MANHFKRFGTMIDCSRNAVPKVSTVKQWIDLTADLGYNMLMLYTEDTWEVNGHPYFGYGRGRYSKEELKEMDEYASCRGMELIPCIQTLAHLRSITRWRDYASIADMEYMLLADDERTYQLIDKMFETISQCFTTKLVNIGMDETEMLGRGKYYDIHGDVDSREIFLRHLNRVTEIARAHGLKLCMWSDMFFKQAFGKYYITEEKAFDPEVSRKISEDVELIYWDYDTLDKDRCDLMMRSHEKLKSGTWFAGGFTCWHGFAPHNLHGIDSTRVAIRSCRDNHIENVIMTLWGDDGAECSLFETLPALFCASEFARGIEDMEMIKARFFEKYHIRFDDFMLLDLLDSPNGKRYIERGVRETYIENGVCNADKYLLYNDLFTGVLDSTLTGMESHDYTLCASKLEPLKDADVYGYLFEMLYNLSNVLALKAELGQITRNAYHSGNKEALEALLEVYDELLERLEIFYQSHRSRWMKENKAQGFDIQDIRLGGLIRRVKDCRQTIEDYVNGRIAQIEELEEPLLDFHGNGSRLEHKPIYFNNWKKNVSVGAI